MSSGVPQQSFGSLVRRKIASARFHLRVLLGQGATPDTLLLGARKGGTTSLYRWLIQHPAVSGGRHKEPLISSLHAAKSDAWYRANYTRNAATQVVLDASTDNLATPSAPFRMRHMLASPRLIALLREPTARAASHYQMLRDRGEEDRSFDEALEAEFSMLRQIGDARICQGNMLDREPPTPGYVSGGLYAPQLRLWEAIFPDATWLVLKSEEMFADPAGTLKRVEAFLALPHHTYRDLAAHNVGEDMLVTPDQRARIAPWLRDSNREIAERFGIEWAD